ncbi:MAG: hypothetical protein FJ272_21280 [Planctomycetes bacterium]|nr:hypothetical protein [Planctomycetota bacterium]
MTHAEGPRTRSRLTVVSGTPHLRPSTVLEMGSDMERLYTALYPLGDAQAAGAAAGLSDERARKALQALQDMGFVARQHKNWRCAIPVANETDGEMVRIWAEPIANVVIARLESLHEEGVALAALVERDMARSTVMTFGLIEAARRPFQALEEQMRVSTPDRGRFGQFSVAVFTHEVPGQKSVLHGGLSCSEHETTDGAPYCAYFFHPSVTRRPGIKDLDAAFPFLDDGHPVSEKVLDRLAPFARGLVTADVRARVADSLSVPRPRHDEFWRRLAQLHAVGGAGEETRLAVPLLPLAAWKDYLSLLDGLKAEIAERVADAAEDLRARTLRCSFADCNFADTVLVFFTYLQGLVNEAIASRNWLTMPKEADYSWGALMAV